jgi:predicted transcriptional regulator
MTAKILKDVLERVETWPEAAQTELAQIALEIDAGLGSGLYHATSKELAGIDRGLKASREGRFATDEQVSRTFNKHRPA